MDQLIINSMIPSDANAKPQLLIPKLPQKVNFLIPGLLAITFTLSIGALALPKHFRSASWVLGIITATVGYREADKQQKHQPYYLAAQDASFDVFAIQLANTVESSEKGD